MFKFFRDLKIDSVRVAMIAVIPRCIVRTMSEYRTDVEPHHTLEVFSRRLVKFTHKGKDLGWFDVSITEIVNGRKEVVNGYLTAEEIKKLATLEIVAEHRVVTGFYNNNGEFVECRTPERAVRPAGFRRAYN